MRNRTYEKLKYLSPTIPNSWTSLTWRVMPLFMTISGNTPWAKSKITRAKLWKSNHRRAFLKATRIPFHWLTKNLNRWLLWKTWRRTKAILWLGWIQTLYNWKTMIVSLKTLKSSSLRLRSISENPTLRKSLTVILNRICWTLTWSLISTRTPCTMLSRMYLRAWLLRSSSGSRLSKTK